MNEIYDQEGANLREIVVRNRRVMIRSLLVSGLLRWVTITFGMWLGLFFLDNLLHLPAGLRLAISLGGAGLVIFELWKRVLSPVFQLGGLESTALLLERRYRVPENMLINALCFERRQLRSGERPFARQTMRAAASLMAKADPKQLWELRRTVRWLTAVSVLLLLWIVYGIGWGRYAANALARFARPLADVPPAGSVVLKITPSADVTLAEADDLTVSVEVVGGGDSRALQSYPEIAWLEGADYVMADESKNKTVTMQAAENRQGVYSYTFKAVKQPFAFRVFAANTHSPSVRANVNRVPRIEESQFRISPPSYTGLGPASTVGPPEPVSGLADSQVVVDVTLDKQAEGLWWKAADGTIEFKHVDNTLWRAETQLHRAGSYQVDVKGPGVKRQLTIASGSILLQQDSAPKIELANAGGNGVVNPGDRLRFDITASDDFGIRQIYLTRRETRTESEAETVRSWPYKGPPGRKGQVEEKLLLSVDAGVFKPGGSYVLQAFCQDYSPLGNVGTSQPLTLQVKSLDELTISDDDPDKAAFAALQKAIQAQQTALGVTKNLLTNLDDVIDRRKPQMENIKSVQRHQAELDKRQKRVGDCMTEAWDASSPPRPAFVNKLAALRDAEHARVIERIETIGAKPGGSEDGASTPVYQVTYKLAVSHSLESIERLQAFLLEQLIALTGVVARQSEIEAEKAAAEILGQGDDLFGTSAEEALKEMVGELDEFIAQQKEIMHDRQLVMDKPPEDFSTDDEDSLEVLALDQSKLAGILSNVVNDFTNLDLQDFGDDAMVESVKSLYEQADELAEKAGEAAQMRQARVDAYRLETEAVEMAEELMINCEATLGFYDNIQFIAEIPEDEQLVAPLAELPWELEDLVGDLITSEEEMRPEVEDIGSYLTSLDHTAGPVADGTISSTSAKGKTGDQKPEDNIIQGRSGAGRSGMSDGQLVEPVAKALPDNEYGLRERISSTPLESGQVQDEDTKARTGGTGLGKTTDHTSVFGPGGRLPPRVLDMMTAAATKQANIRQAARELVPKLRRYNLPTAELENSARAMTQVEQALQNRTGIGIRTAYNEVVNTLKKSYQAVGKEIAVQYTRDEALAKKLENMLSQQQRLRFKGYEHMISAYFEALARGRDNAEPNSPPAGESKTRR